MKIVLSSLFLLCFLLSGNGQSILDQIKERVIADNSFDTLNVELRNSEVISGIEFVSFICKYPFVGSEFSQTRTTVLEVKDNSKSLNDKLISDYSLTGSSLIKGSIINSLVLDNGILLLAEEKLQFEFSERNHYRVYYLDQKSKNLIKIDLEETGFENYRCLSKSIKKTFNLRAGSPPGIRITTSNIKYTKCKEEISTSSQDFIFNEDQKTLRATKFKIQKTKNLGISGIWIQDYHGLNGIEQRDNSIFEFDSAGNIILWKLNMKLAKFDQLMIGKYQLDPATNKITYQFNNFDAEYTGNFFIDGDTLLQEAIAVDDVKFYGRSLVCSRAFFDKDVSFAKARISDPEDINISKFVNALFSDRLDLLEFYLETGFDLNTVMNIKTGDEVQLGYPIHFVASHGKIEAMKLLIQYGVDLNQRTFYQKSVYDIALMANQTEMVRFLEPYTIGITNNQFPSKNRLSLEQFFRNQKGWSKEEGKVECWTPREKHSILFYNVVLSAPGNKPKTEEYCVYYFQDKEGLWITSSDRNDFPFRVTGHCKELMKKNDELFMVTEGTFISDKDRRSEFGVRILDEEQGVFIKTNLFFNELRGSYDCDFTRKIYEIVEDVSSPDEITLIQKTEEFKGCKATLIDSSAVNYYWSKRQNKFLKTIE